MAVVEIPMDRVTDRESFHDVFAEVLGFPDFYGRNMAAWIDCMSDPGLRSVSTEPGEILTLHLKSYASFKEREPELLNDLLESAAFVNWRYIASGEESTLALAYYE